MNNSEIADALGVNEWTVRDDKKRLSGNPESESSPATNEQGSDGASVEESGNPEPAMPAGQDQADAILADIDEQVAAGIEPEPDDEPEPIPGPEPEVEESEPEAEEPELEPEPEPAPAGSIATKTNVHLRSSQGEDRPTKLTDIGQAARRRIAP